MHLYFTTLCVAIAVCLVAGSHAAPSWSNPKSPYSLPEVPNKGHLRSDALALDEEERGFSPNAIPLSSMLEQSDSLTTETISTKFGTLLLELFDYEDIQLSFLKEQEQLSRMGEEEKMGLLKLLKELVQLVESEDKQLTLLNDWESFSNSFADELKNVKSQAFKQLLIGRIKTKDNMKTVADENLNKLLKVWKPTAEASESEPESSTKRLQAWLKNDESPDRLFTVLGIHKAVDKAANKFLISANLERWNYFMELFYDGAGHYNFEDQLKTTLQPFCEDDLCMTLFLERLVILRERRNTEHKKWLNEMKEPQEVYALMKVDNEENQFVRKKLAAWITYVDAYNDLYPHRQTTLSACSPYSEEELIKMSFHGETRYPQIGPKRRILADILKSWADAKPPLSPAEVFNRLDVSPQGTELSTKPLSGLQKYIKLINARKQPNEKSEFESKLEKRINELLNKPKMRKNAKSIERFDKLLKGRWSKKSSKRKSKSLPDGARERKRSRGD